jgi:hypothetical protein
MAKKKIDPRVQRMIESFNRKPTLEEEADFYRRNAGGPIATYPSLTRGRGVVSGIVGDYDWHVGTRRAFFRAKEIDAWMETDDAKRFVPRHRKPPDQP